jgi:hypothetical protein
MWIYLYGAEWRTGGTKLKLAVAAHILMALAGAFLMVGGVSRWTCRQWRKHLLNKAIKSHRPMAPSSTSRLPLTLVTPPRHGAVRITRTRSETQASRQKRQEYKRKEEGFRTMTPNVSLVASHSHRQQVAQEQGCYENSSRQLDRQIMPRSNRYVIIA